MSFYYFAYGSNMSSVRLKSRAPSAQFFAVATLEHHLLKFHKKGFFDGTAKADAFFTGNSADTVYGVVYTLKELDLKKLRNAEGYGFGYEEKEVELITTDADPVVAMTYYATSIDATLKPYYWYIEHVLNGAREHRLPEHYIRQIEQIEVIDPDQSEIQ